MQLPAFLAALIGLGVNYDAYESEIYRGALEAIPRRQLDTAQTIVREAAPSERLS